MMPREASLAISREEIDRRVGQLGAEIASYYEREGKGPLCMVAVLKGSFIFLADLIRRIEYPLLVDFLGITSYSQEDQRGGVVRFTKDLTLGIEGRDVLLVEDIVDTGLTLSFIIRTLKERRPRTVEVCGLLNRGRRRIADLPLRFVGFDVGEDFLVGYGLDQGHLYRNLPDIYRLSAAQHGLSD
jgi:hypoxanthine phosphoribosyltransferase